MSYQKKIYFLIYGKSKPLLQIGRKLKKRKWAAMENSVEIS